MNKVDETSPNEYMTFVDHPLVTIEMAREYVKVLQEEYQPFESEFLEAKLPGVIEGNKDSIQQINNLTQLEFRLREIVSISNEFSMFYREPLVKALYKKAMEQLSERVQYVREGYTIDSNREFRMAMEFLGVVSEPFLTHILNMDAQRLFSLDNRTEVIEKIRLFTAGVIWTQSNIGSNVHDVAATQANKAASVTLEKIMSGLRKS
ncbi:hypothetical protein ACXHQ0_14945 [Vibrio antiquarius]|uniref:Uncharacterized protein n=1 Tax=Vibrio parahaemolyticus TaxID=670 RepID=A0AA46UQ13_VIBPH|nr:MULTISPECIES: hypothetical protein [Vibrio]KOE80319.1 hypothetical protein ACS91_22725 [Vibrio parahaemolyticus]MCS0314369.1 hypothetical protein [Vibrio diabolicus]MDW1925898.1 hypothetical protein [Vibrio sp. 947]UYV29586.1 hypothetical protein M5598_26790 [Vibrio parahaemolyticus]UYW19371.1 hypothetical protein IF561_29510 [Vibrio parahaemolyticus]